VKVDITRERLASLTRNVRTELETAGKTGFQRSAALSPALRELDRLLVAPLAGWLPSSPAAPVVVIPHGPLALLPFAALEDDAGRPLAERYTLSFAPAASVYQHTRDKLGVGRGAPRRALIVADPLPPAESGMPRLPWAGEEGRRVAERLRGTSVRILTGPDASEAAVKREAAGCSLLHFATHGLIAPDRPLASSLLLGAGGGEDGYLRVDEVFDLDLHAELVVLSGCSTGLGQLTGDGVIGLTRAFLYAGTPSVVVSQWDVSDRATALLMDRFYASLQQGESKAAALRAAQLATRRRFAHPALWAAFMLVGEPR
jgi:CHAT domain-containing protein